MTTAVLEDVQARGRALRRPKHTFQLRQRPYQIQPFMLAPVLPGETLKNLLMQARAVTSPIKNPLIGWHAEYYFFYVKLTDLDIHEDIKTMFLTNASLAAYNEAASVPYYHAGGAPNWAKLCLERVVNQYFRDEDEAFLAGHLDNIPIAQVNTQSWLDDVRLNSNVPSSGEQGEHELPGEGMIPSDVPAGFEDHYAQWEFMRSMKLTEATFEDFLKTYGIKVAAAAKEPLRKPELIRYIRDWSYPTNTVNPADGTPTSAVSWAVAERADKDRFFQEPGFVFACSVFRPKVYFSNQAGSASMMLSDAFSWLPATADDKAYMSLREFAEGAGPLSGLDITGTGDSYWVDVRDLFMYGDQFVNFALTETDAGLVALPTAGMNKRYLSATDVDGLFVGSTAATRLIRQDGVVSLSIASKLRDRS